MHNGKYQCHTAASCTYHLPSSPGCSTRAIRKSLTLNKKTFESFLGEKPGELTTSRKTDKTERARGLRRKTREEIRKGGFQMTALRFQTGKRHQTSMASLWGTKIDITM